MPDSKAAPAATPEAQLRGFIARFSPEMGKLIRACRATLRRRFPTANELVYDNYNFFVIGYVAGERPSDCLVSLAVNAKGVGLSFYYGAALPDPEGLLQGGGSQNRFIRLPDAKVLRDPGVERLLRAAVDHAAKEKTPLPESGKGRLIIRSISAKQRPRRDK